MKGGLSDELAAGVVEVLLPKALITMRKSKDFHEEEAIEELRQAIKKGKRRVDANHTVLTWLQNQFKSLFDYNFQFHSRDNKLELLCQQEVGFDDVCQGSFCWIAWWRLKDRTPEVRKLQKLAVLNLLVAEQLSGNTLANGMAESFAEGYHETQLIEELERVHKNRQQIQDGKAKKLILDKQKKERTDCYSKEIYQDLVTLESIDEEEMNMWRLSFSSRSEAVMDDYRSEVGPGGYAAQDWFMALLRRYEARFATWQQLVKELERTLASVDKRTLQQLVDHNNSIPNLDHYNSLADYVCCSVALSLHALDISTPSIYGEDKMPSMRDFDPHFQARDLGTSQPDEQFCILDFTALSWCTDDLIGRDQCNTMNGYYQEDPSEPAKLLELALPDGSLPVMATTDRACNFLRAIHETVRHVEFGNYLTRGAYQLSRKIVYFSGHTGCQESQYNTNWDFTPWFNNDHVFRNVLAHIRKETFGAPKQPRTLLEILGEQLDETPLTGILAL